MTPFFICCICQTKLLMVDKPSVEQHLKFNIILFSARPRILTKTQWYMVVNKRVQWVFFDNIFTKWLKNSSSIPNKNFRGLVVRRPAFHTEIRGSIPLAGSFVFFLVFQKKASALASVVQKPPIPTDNDCYLQNRHDSGYHLILYLFHMVLRGDCLHRFQKSVFYLMNLLKLTKLNQKS